MFPRGSIGRGTRRHHHQPVPSFPLRLRIRASPGYRAHARRLSSLRDIRWADRVGGAPADRRGELRALIEERNRLAVEIDRLSAGEEKLPGPEEMFVPLSRREWESFFYDPGALATTCSASTSSGSISAGKPITISSSVIPENVREPSHPSEKFGFPVR